MNSQSSGSEVMGLGGPDSLLKVSQSLNQYVVQTAFSGSYAKFMKHVVGFNSLYSCRTEVFAALLVEWAPTHCCQVPPCSRAVTETLS